MAEPVIRDGRAFLFDRSGRRVTVDQSELDQALKSGFTPETAESIEQYDKYKEAQTLGGLAKTAGEATLRGATLGASDVALTEALGDDYRDNALARQQANPTLSTIGETAGAIAPILASGGSGAAARGLSVIGTPARGAAALGRAGEAAAGAGLRALGYAGESAIGRVGARALGMAAGGAAEGAAYGAGKAVSDAALGGTDLTSEKLLAGIEEGALFGGMGGGVLGGGGQALGEVGKRVISGMTGGKPLQQILREGAQSRKVKSVTGNYKKAFDELTNFGENPERLQRVGQKMIDRGIKTDVVEEAIPQFQAQLDDAVQRQLGVAKRLDDVGVRVDADQILSKVEAQVSKLKAVELEDFQAVAKKVEDQIAPFRSKVEGPGELGVSKVKRGADGKRTLEPIEGKKYSFSELWELRKRIDETISWSKKSQSPATDALRDLRRTFDDALTETIATQGDDALRRLAEQGDEGAAKVLADGDTLSKQWSGAKEDYHDFVTLRDAAENLAEMRAKNRFISPSDYGTGGLFGVGATQAMIASGGAALPALLMGAATGAAASFAHKLIRERGSAFMAKLGERASKVDGSLLKSAKVLAGLAKAKRTVTPAVLGLDKLGERYDALSERVQESISNPQGFATRLAQQTRDLDDAMPELGAAVKARVVGDYQYLAAEMPKPMGRGASTLTPNAVKPHFNPVEQKRWVAKAEALDQPMKVIEKLEQGILDRSGLEAIKARRPQLWQDLQVKVLEGLATRGDELTLPQRVTLSVVFDVTGDTSMRPAVLADLQAAVTATPGLEPQPGPAPRSFDPSVSEAMTLPSQKAAGG